MHRSILITGANVGLGKETARQLAMNQETERIILACRNAQKAEAAKQELDKWHNDIKSVLLDPAKRQHEKEMVEANRHVPNGGASQSFTMMLNGIVDAAVSGGVKNFEPFLTRE